LGARGGEGYGTDAQVAKGRARGKRGRKGIREHEDLELTGKEG